MDNIQQDTVIMYPGTSVSLLIGKRLITSGHNLHLFCPNAVHLRMAGTVPADLKIVALEGGSTVQVVEDVGNLGIMDFIIFPTLDVLPEKSRQDFGQMCRNLFR